MKFIVHTDGGARGNPGPAAVGVVVERVGVDGKKEKLHEFGKRIGEATNNVAEYAAVVAALKWIEKYLPRSGISLRETITQFFLDSDLVVNQLNGNFKVKEPHLRELLFAIRQLEQEVGGVVRYVSVPREQNHRADFLVNQALDTPHVA